MILRFLKGHAFVDVGSQEAGFGEVRSPAVTVPVLRCYGVATRDMVRDLIERWLDGLKVLAEIDAFAFGLIRLVDDVRVDAYRIGGRRFCHSEFLMTIAKKIAAQGRRASTAEPGCCVGV